MVSPTTLDIDMVRLLIGDRAGALLEEHEVVAFLEANGLNRYAAAADCADAIAASYASRVDVRAGILSSSDSQLSAQYRRLADDLRKRDAGQRVSGAAPWAGGVRVADRQAREADDTLAAPAFVRERRALDGDDERC